jgi:hypothetical protein
LRLRNQGRLRNRSFELCFRTGGPNLFLNEKTKPFFDAVHLSNTLRTSAFQMTRRRGGGGQTTISLRTTRKSSWPGLGGSPRVPPSEDLLNGAAVGFVEAEENLAVQPVSR